MPFVSGHKSRQIENTKVTENCNDRIKIMLLRDTISVGKTTAIIKKMIGVLAKREDSPVKLLSFTFSSSNTTIQRLMHGNSRNMEHYIILFSYYSRNLGWKQDLSRTPEFLEKALKDGNTLVIGVKDRKTGKIVEYADLFWKE